MRHTVLERWSRGSSFLHRRDPRIKILTLLVFLIAVAITHAHFEAAALCYLTMLIAGVFAGRLSLWGALRRAAIVLPFSIALAAATWIAGEPRRALLLMEKIYLSAWATLLLVATTPLPQLIRGFELLGTPRFLLMVAQFVYRYLFVIAEQAHGMRIAAICRGGGGFRAAAATAAVLFVRSYERAGDIHRGMISRGFDGQIRLLAQPRLRAADVAFGCLVSVPPLTTALLARIG